MRTTVTLDDELVDKAAALTGIEERSALLREAMKVLVRVESARRLAGSSCPGGAAPPECARVILVDTNVWIDHLHAREPVLAAILEQDEAARVPGGA